MATDSTRQPATIRTIPQRRSGQAPRRHRVSLLHDIQVVERALAVPAADPAWRRRLAVRLGRLHGTFAEHVVVTEGPDGLYAELLDHAPRLARAVQVLIREHGAVAATIAALRRQVDLPEAGVDELRGCGNDLLRELSRHRQRGADLVYQAYQLDIGGET